MKPRDIEQTNRLRTILQRMERSIDDARARRVDGPGRSDAVRDAETMFDVKGPRLKARPKRSTDA